jgi:membrane carboxypeptidase/penicillin-binding protein
MDIQSHIMRFRRERRIKDRSNPLGKTGLVIAGFLSVTIAVLSIILVYRYSIVTRDLPSPEVMKSLLNAPGGSLLEPTRIFDNGGDIVLWRFENPAIEYRKNIYLTDGNILFFTDVPEVMVQATVIAEDPDYFQKPTNFLSNLLINRSDPIPQNLIMDLLLWDESDHPYRQIRINILADQVVSEFGREKVFEWFLNSAYYGNQIYGLNQAARFYFGKSVDSLSLAESALLAAVAKYPSLNPYDAPTAAKENQEYILNEMQRAELITIGQARLALREELIYVDHGSAVNPPLPPYVEFVMEEAEELIPLDRLIRGGFNIISTLDSDLQSELECTSAVMMARVAGETPDLEESCQASKLLPKYTGPEIDEEAELEINLVLTNPQEGTLLAMAVSPDENGAGTMFEPKIPGSLISPFIYLNSFAQGFEPASLVWDIPIKEDMFTSEELHPITEGQINFLGPINMRSAITNDYLSPAIQLWDTHGVQRIKNTLVLFGFSIPEEDCQECQYFPGSSRLKMIDLVQGFGVFANQGTLRGRSSGGINHQIKPSALIRIEALSGVEWFHMAPGLEKKVISEELTYLVNQTLSDENARNDLKVQDMFQIGRPAGVKMGVVAGASSGWVVGYTPQLVAGVWAGIPQEFELTQQPDYQQITASLWRAVTQYASKDLEVTSWQIPEGIIVMDVCYPSGMLPTENCPRIIREVFIQGNEPQQIDSLYQVIEVNRETGLRASVFTSSDQIQERVYLTIPPEAAEWAEQVGLPIPPEIYDLELPSPSMKDLTLDSPENFSFVHGKVNILGSIPEDDFVSARLQFGRGLNPTSWLQIGDEILTAGSNKRLGLWDTEGLEDGLYALQLVVVKELHQVEKTALVVSVDNTAPEILLNLDLNGENVQYQSGAELLFQAEFENENEIQEVKFYLDSILASSRLTPPFIFPWQMEEGEHELRVVAYDHAKNKAVITTSFEVVRD